MQAIVQDHYGTQEALELREVDKPQVADGEVLVRVRAASVHLGDWVLVKGEPYVLRLATGLRRPRHRVPGTDIAGIVEAVGAGVTGLPAGRRGLRLVHGRLRGIRRTDADHCCPSQPT